MNGIAFLKAAYTVAWVIYLGYLGSMLARYRRLREEMKDLERSK